MNLLFAAWFACSPPDAPPVDAVYVAAAPAPREITGARVVTDVSSSMRGFVGKGVALATLHEEIARAVGENAHGAAEWCVVDEQVHDCVPTLPDHARYARADFYGAKAAAYHLGLDDALQRGVTVVVTDGGVGGTASGDAAGEGCAAGSTVACVSDRLAQIVTGGGAVYAVVLRMPFDGRVFAERAMDDEMFGRIAANIAPPALVTDFDGSKARASYRYAGPRPMMVMIAGADAAAVQGVGETLTRAMKGLRPDWEIVGAPWAPLSTGSLRVAGIDVAEGTPGFLLEGNQEVAGVIEQDITCGFDDKAWIDLRTAPAGAGYHVEAHPNVPAEVMVVDERDGVLRLGVVCAGLPVSSVRHRLGLAWRRDPEPLDATWHEWSAPDSFSRPAGLFGLEPLATRVHTEAASLLAPVPLAVIHIQRTP